MVGKRRVGGCAVDIVALDALIELSEAGAENSPARAEDIPCKTNSGLKCEVVVFHDAAGETVLTGELNAVQVEGSSVVGRECGTYSRATGRRCRADCTGVVEDCCCRRVVVPGNEIGDLVVLLI